MLRYSVARGSQVKEVYLAGQLVKCRYIALQLCALMWEMLGKALHETLLSFGHTISGTVGGIVYLVHALAVYGLQTKLLLDA